MLQRLVIRNVALIEQAELEFSEGLNVLSGETGAGKSVILDAIDFVLGAKADRNMIRSGESFCLVQAEFSVTDLRIDDILNEYDIEPGDVLIVSRKLTSDGKSALRLNGSAVTVSMLRRITALLVDVHGQSEHFFLLKDANQLKLLDEVAGESVALIKKTLAGQLSDRRKLLSDREKLGGDEGERERRNLGTADAQGVGGADVSRALLLDVLMAHRLHKDLAKGNAADEVGRGHDRDGGDVGHHGYSPALSAEALERKRRRMGVPLRSNFSRMRFSM